jgi:pre-rRNA-processing protein TSR1
VQQVKRQSLIEAARIFNGVDGAPRIIAVIPLAEDVHAKDIVLSFARNMNPDVDEKELKDCPDEGVWRLRLVMHIENYPFLLTLVPGQNDSDQVSNSFYYHMESYMPH